MEPLQPLPSPYGIPACDKGEAFRSTCLENNGVIESFMHEAFIGDEIDMGLADEMGACKQFVKRAWGDEMDADKENHDLFGGKPYSKIRLEKIFVVNSSHPTYAKLARGTLSTSTCHSSDDAFAKIKDKLCVDKSQVEGDITPSGRISLEDCRSEFLSLLHNGAIVYFMEKFLRHDEAMWWIKVALA